MIPLKWSEISQMNRKRFKLHIGLRTIKTAAAVIIAMIVVDSYGATTSKLIFAMLGAMAAVQPTFKESLESCMTQIIGVLFGALMGVLLLALHVPSLVATGIGIIMVISLYNAFGIRYSPGIPCLIVVTLCTTPDIQPFTYAVGRIWDSAIGLGIGMLINTLIFPYDNSQQIRATLKSLDQELIRFLENMFDGDDILPDADEMSRQIAGMERQLKIFSNQKLIMHMRRQQQELEIFRRCEGKAKVLVARMEVLSRMEHPGRLNEENRQKLIECGAVIQDERPLELLQEVDVVVNYHVRQILILRQELMDVLNDK